MTVCETKLLCQVVYMGKQLHSKWLLLQLHFFFVGVILRRHAESSGHFLCALLLENNLKMWGNAGCPQQITLMQQVNET